MLRAMSERYAIFICFSAPALLITPARYVVFAGAEDTPLFIMFMPQEQAAAERDDTRDAYIDYCRLMRQRYSAA